MFSFWGEKETKRNNNKQEKQGARRLPVIADVENSSMNYSTSPHPDVRTLMEALEEAQQREASAKNELAKSHSIILELRSNNRQQKRQLKKLEKEHKSDELTIQHYEAELQTLRNSVSHNRQKEQHEPELQSQVANNNSAAHDESIVGELHTQLDRAHAQIQAADMVRKELEDTLEAEQYTWELRVEDQERTIQSLQSECRTLKEDLEHNRLQWEEAEQGLREKVQELQHQLEDSDSKSPSVATSSDRLLLGYQDRIDALDKERYELQGCLDEAMKELEDMELRQESNSCVGPLQDLLRWLMEAKNHDVDHDSQIPDTTDELVEAIQSLIEPDISTKDNLDHLDTTVNVAELEAQLRARDESTAELRASLKEAIALLKLLQDAAAKSEGEKMALQDQLDELMQN